MVRAENMLRDFSMSPVFCLSFVFDSCSHDEYILQCTCWSPHVFYFTMLPPHLAKSEEQPTCLKTSTLIFCVVKYIPTI